MAGHKPLPAIVAVVAVSAVLAACLVAFPGCAQRAGPPTLTWLPGAPPAFTGTADAPRRLVTSAWPVAAGLWLFERTEGIDTGFWLWNERDGELKTIVGFIENARFRGVDGDGRLYFRAIGGDDTGHFRFPYTLSYDLATGQLERGALYLPLEEAVTFGKSWAWSQAIVGVAFEGNAVRLDFQPRPGEVLAGGHCLPRTEAAYDAGAGELVLLFRRVSVGPGVQGGTDILPPTGGAGAGSLVKKVIVEAVGEDLRVRVALSGASMYTAETTGRTGGEYASTISCQVTFRAGE